MTWIISLFLWQDQVWNNSFQSIWSFNESTIEMVDKYIKISFAKLWKWKFIKLPFILFQRIFNNNGDKRLPQSTQGKRFILYIGRSKNYRFINTQKKVLDLLIKENCNRFESSTFNKNLIEK